MLAQQSADLRDSKAEQDAAPRVVGKWWLSVVLKSELLRTTKTRGESSKKDMNDMSGYRINFPVRVFLREMATLIDVAN